MQNKQQEHLPILEEVAENDKEKELGKYQRYKITAATIGIKT